MDLSHAYVAVRDLDADGGPAAPAAWERTVQGDTGWTTLRLPGGAIVAAYKINAVGARGLFAIAGPLDVLDAIAATSGEIMPAREAWRRRADDTSAPGEASPQQIVRAWRCWRCDVIERDEFGDPLPEVFGVVRTLSSVGVLLPATNPPWNLAADGTVTTQALAVRRVTAVHRPALAITLAGHSIHTTTEDEEDPGA